MAFEQYRYKDPAQQPDTAQRGQEQAIRAHAQHLVNAYHTHLQINALERGVAQRGIVQGVADELVGVQKDMLSPRLKNFCKRYDTTPALVEAILTILKQERQ